MNNRLLILAGALLLLTAAVVLVLRIAPALQPSSAAAILTIEASNAGAPLAKEDCLVYVHGPGSPGPLVAEGALGQPLSLLAGRYDVRVVFTRSRDQQSLWLREVDLEAGQQLTRTARFSAGEINVEASVGTHGTENGQVVAYVFRPGEHDEFVTTMGTGEPALLSAGAYDLRVVWSVESQEKDTRWFQSVQVKTGLQTKVKVPFDRGLLLVEATNSGQALAAQSVTLTVYRAGDAQQEVLDSGLAGVPLGLASGRYDVKATYANSSDKPVRWLHDLEVRNGEVAEHGVAFASGALTVEALVKSGRPLNKYDVYVYYYAAGDHQQALAYMPAGEAAVLSAGRYDVRVTYFRSNDQPDIWIRSLALESGESQAETVVFMSGELLVRAYDYAGEELIGDNVFVSAYAAGERSKPIATARSGELLTLTEGRYDVRAEDTRSGKHVRWLEDIELRAGKLTEESVEFLEP